MAKKTSQSNSNDITALLSKIDDLVSISGHLQDINARQVPRSKMKTEVLKDEGFLDAQLEEIAKGIDEGLPVDVYAKTCYNWMQMHEIRRGLQAHLDTGFYESPLYSSSQMREIRLGLWDHLDVSSYATLVLSATDMRRMRHSLFAAAYKEDPENYGKSMKNDETGILVRISNDCMKAFITIPKNTKRELTPSDLMDVLEQHDITYGILQENLEKIVREKIFGQEVCVASGKPPLIGKAGWFELFFDNGIEKGHTAPPDGDIDYTDVNIVDPIVPGQMLARYHGGQRDVSGITVTGITVEGTPGEELPFLTGSGFQHDLQQNVYIATDKGFASYNGTTGTLNVWNVYHVNGDVPYYQSLEYDGAVHVHGSVRGSATIRAMGDIIIDGFVENAFIFSQHDIVIKGGANGGEQGKIEAGGTLRGNFFENIDIKAGGMIEGNYYLNCKIFTDDRLIARGKKARIMGGSIEAAVGVEAVIVGNYLSNKTIFKIGDQHALHKRLTALSADREKILNELEQLSLGQQRLLLLLGEEQAAKNTLYTRTCAAIQIKEEQCHSTDHEIARLKLVIKRAEKAYVRIHGELQQDILFIINGSRKKIDKATSHGVLLKAKGASKR